MRKIIGVFFVFIGCFLSIPSYAELCHYTDNKGIVHFVNDISEVPEQYRGQVKNVGSLPELAVGGRSSPAPGNPSSLDVPSVDTSTKKTIQYDGTVEIFMTSWCGYCKKLAAFLDSKGIRYRTYDIEKDSSANRTYRELGGRGVPLSRIGSTIVRGYNPEAVLKAIEKER